MAVPTTDRLIANRYALRTALARGEVGTVWHAQDTLLGREVVVREIVFPPWLAGPERRAPRASVLGQAGAVARLTHPGVVTVFDVVADDHGIFIVTELVQAPSLADLVRAEGPLPPLQVAEIGAEVASVLEVAHSAGIVHRDVKPANVMVRKTVVCGWPALASPHSRVSHNWRRPPWPSARPPTWRRSRREGGQAALRPTCGRLARPSSLPSRERRRSTRAPWSGRWPRSSRKIHGRRGGPARWRRYFRRCWPRTQRTGYPPPRSGFGCAGWAM